MLDFLKSFCPVRVCIDDSGGEFTGWPSLEGKEGSDTTLIHRAGFKQEFFGDLSQRQAVELAHEIARLLNEAHGGSWADLGLLERVKRFRTLLPGAAPNVVVVLDPDPDLDLKLSDSSVLDLQEFGLPGKVVHGWAARTPHSSGTEVMVLRDPPDGRVLRTCIALGCQTVLIASKARGIEAKTALGDLMVVSDHLNLTGTTPLHPTEVDPHHMPHIYDTGLIEIARRVASQMFGHTIRRGVFAGVRGPQTRSELRMLKGLGADIVGMSIVPEAIVANLMGVRVLALCGVTTLAEEPVAGRSHSDLLRIDDLPHRFSQLLQGVLAQLG